MIRNPLLHPNWTDVETLNNVKLSFNAADTSLAREWSDGGIDGDGTAYSLLNRAIANALYEIFVWAEFDNPAIWAGEVAWLALDSGVSFTDAYKHAYKNLTYAQTRSPF